ncbi:MAG: hypothetical protein RLZZ450_6480 [Pseudomonadota bacterium]|jgi:hypothetical protein
MHFVRFGLAFMAELAKGELQAPEPVCSATKACPTGQRCENDACVPDAPKPDPNPNGVGACVGGSCVAPTGSVGAGSVGVRDAGRAQGDASVVDAGSKKPTVRTASDPSTADEEDEDEARSTDDENDARASRRDAGCAVSATRGTQRGVSTLWPMATLLVLCRRRKRR